MRRYRIVDADPRAAALGEIAGVPILAIADADTADVFGYVRADRAQAVVDSLNADVVVPIEEGQHSMRADRLAEIQAYGSRPRLRAL
jgi:hypothetical protein